MIFLNKFNNPDITKQRIKCFARLMSAKAGETKWAGDFRKFVHAPSIRTIQDGKKTLSIDKAIVEVFA